MFDPHALATIGPAIMGEGKVEPAQLARRLIAVDLGDFIGSDRNVPHRTHIVPLATREGVLAEIFNVWDNVITHVERVSNYWAGRDTRRGIPYISRKEGF